MNNKRGFVLLLTFIFMISLTIIVTGLLFMVAHEPGVAGSQTQDSQMVALADAGVDRVMRELRDEALSATPTVGSADLRGNDTSLSTSVTNPNNMRYINDGSNATFTTGTAIIRTFDSNYANTIITSVSLNFRASTVSGSGPAVVQAAYTLNGSTYTNAGATQTLTTTITEYTRDITTTATKNWANLMSANFRIRLVRSSGSRTVNLDSLYLRVTYQIDTLNEPWATGSYATFPVSLGPGQIQSISTTAEQGKVHLNTAPQLLLTNLMIECGISSGTASTLAANIVTYRTTKYLDSVEELQQVAGMTSAYYNLIRDYVTVYSFNNAYATRPSPSTAGRAPININTAPSQVLKAVFDPLGLGTGDPQSLANDIVTFRNSTPFTCFYTSNTAVTTDFYEFVNSRTYLTATEKNIVLDNADASTLIPVSGYAGSNAVTTEFSYDVNAYKVESVSDVGGRHVRVKAVIGKDGSRKFTTYNGDTAPVSYWRCNYE